MTQKEVALTINGVKVNIPINTVPKHEPIEENRFGVSLEHANAFIAAFKNQKVKGYKVCNRYHMTGQSASIHAETELWNLLNYKVSLYNLCCKGV